MAAMYDGDNNRVFELDNTYKWEDCYGDEVLIPENQRTKDGDSPKEQLASLVKGGSNAKGYTLTEYINDINRENTEVLAEHGADEKVRQAYTYGESGIGERVSVDKSEESSYYLYDGRNSVTGILTENANLTNSYQHDPYGNLTSGTADGVNYYGYNGESTNAKTGLQYLRARYYDAENGDFISEDEDLGDEEEPLTMNRYQYTTNNPVNYDDTTGNKKKAKNSKKSSKKSAKKSSKKSSKKSPVKRKKVSKIATNKKTSISKKKVSKNSRYVKRISKSKSNKKHTSFLSNIQKKANKVLGKVKKIGCGAAKHITKQVKSIDKATAIAIVATVAVGIVTGGVGVAAAGALGLTSGSLGAMIAAGAVNGAIGGTIYGVTHATVSGKKPNQVIKETVKETRTGMISGAVVGGLGYAVSGELSSANRGLKQGHITEMADNSSIPTKPEQVHHYATNKNKVYTPQFEEITQKYGLDLDEEWNKDLLPHQGRHPNAYHEYVLESMKQFDYIAQGNKKTFIKLYENLKENVKANPDMLYKEYWK